MHRARSARQGGRLPDASNPARRAAIPGVMPRWRCSIGGGARPRRHWLSSAWRSSRGPDLPALYRDRAGVVLDRENASPARGAGPRRPGSGDRAGEAGRPRPGRRPHRSRPAPGPRRPIDRRAGGLRRRDRAAPRLRGRPPVAVRPDAPPEAARGRDPRLRRADREGKGTAAIYERRALAREAIRDFPGAVEDFTAAIALGGDRAKLLRRRGWLYIVADCAPHGAERLPGGRPSGSRDSPMAHDGRGLVRRGSASTARRLRTRRRRSPWLKPTAAIYYDAARVYALAAIVVTAEARKKGRESVRAGVPVPGPRRRGCSARRSGVPADRRDWFMKEVVLVDPTCGCSAVGCRRGNWRGRSPPLPPCGRECINDDATPIEA